MSQNESPNTPPADSPYTMKEDDKDRRKLKPTVKSYKNQSFLDSGDARIIRILCEFQEPGQRLAERRVRGTILFFGSARSMTPEQHQQTLEGLKKQHAAAASSPNEQQVLAAKIEQLEKVEWMCEWTVKTEILSRKLTEWSMVDPILLKALNIEETAYLQKHQVFGEYRDDVAGGSNDSAQPLVITTGGGPGIMESANKGAASVPGALTMGMGISLPFEKGLNPYVSDGLEFEFHYFFTRKFWMMYFAKALIIAPGGFGTMDELFELMTLRQTKKIPKIPIVLFCSKYWKTVINWQAMADFGTISQSEVDNLFFADDADEAFQYIKQTICGTVSNMPPISPSSSPFKSAKASQERQ